MKLSKTARLLGACSVTALGLCTAPAGLLAFTLIAAPAAAQDYTSGAFSGDVRDTSGASVGGATVTITSNQQGFTRTSTTSGGGAFRFPGLAPGDYSVAVSSSAGDTTETVRVAASSTTNYTLVVGSADVVGEVVVTGSRRNLDFSTATTGVTVNVGQLMAKVPVARNLNSITLLAPNAVPGDDTFGNSASLGGSSVAENAYYVNGLNITNFDNYLGSAPVPFDFYESIEVKTGGYPAEFGRATGGVINAVTKSGTNTFTAGIHLNWDPDSLSQNAPNTYQERNSLDEREAFSAVFEAGGPIIHDRLFAYGLVEFRDNKATDVGLLSGIRTTDRDKDPIWGFKLDAYPLDNHHFELTYFDTETQRERVDYRFDNATDTLGALAGRTLFNSGGVSYIGKYTGNLTDWLTLSAAYGVSEDQFEVLPQESRNLVRDANYVAISDEQGGEISSPYDTRREFVRADVDIYFDLFGSHHVRAGFDREENELFKVSYPTGPDNVGAGLPQVTTPGGVQYQQYICGVDTPQCDTGGLVVGDAYFGVSFYNVGGTFVGENTAYYIQDEWKVTPQLTVNLGVRLDQFVSKTADGSTWLDFDDLWAPRLGFAYDVLNDGRTKVFGNYGRYFLPIAAVTSFNAFGSAISFAEYWKTDGTFGDGMVPNLTDQIVDFTGGDTCPFPIFGVDGRNCSVIAAGNVPGGDSFVSTNLEASEEEEFILGVSHRLGDLWTLGLTYTHRNLLQNVEDSAIDDAVNAYCVAEGIAGCGDIWGGFGQYVLVNPGEDVTVTLNSPINGESTLRTVTFSGESLGYPKAKRKYDAVEFTFERALDRGLAFQGSYTWSDSRGNTEGFVQSDYAQTNAGTVIDFDQPGFTEGAYGNLPNHREHQFKLWGSYQVTDAFSVGANAVLASPREFSCLGNYPDVNRPEFFYGHYSRYCLGRLQPRGTGLDGAGLESDWYKNVDLSLRYNLSLPGGFGTTLRADIFNVFNFDSITDRDEYGENDFNSDAIRPEYGMPIGYQRARYVRIGMDITF